MEEQSNAKLAWLEERVGRVHLRQRLGIERDFEARVLGQGIAFFHLENWYSIHGLIRGCLRLSGLYGHGRRNTTRLETNQHDVRIEGLAEAFEGYRILHISDLHLDMSPDLTHVLIESVRKVDYDLCVLTGDYRASTYGPHEDAMHEMQNLRVHLKGPVYGVLGNHDTIMMVHDMEEMGVRMLLNEALPIRRGDAELYLGGIDDAHYFRVDNVEKVAEQIPAGATSILLSHSPETYKQAAHADFSVMLCGHTHGGQICLPGGVPVIYDARCPRSMASGSWRYHDLLGYTSRGSGASIVVARLNCNPEITVHRLCRA
jgi:predicted MPP superfamily phosphohydrolase